MDASLSAPGGPPSSDHARARRDAEVEDIVRVLRRYGALRRARLVELCGAALWSDHGFRDALAHAVAMGRVRRLGDDMYELTESADG